MPGSPWEPAWRGAPWPRCFTRESPPLPPTTTATGWACRSPSTRRRWAPWSVRNDGPDRPYTDADRDVLELVGRIVANALDRTRAIDETRQRNAELALVNEIGDALAKGLDFDAIIELVGERVR